MKYYQELMKLGCFSYADACKLIEDETTARLTIRNYLAHGLLQRICSNLYVAVNSETGLPVVDNRFVIASHISEDSYVTHHTAFEYYGCYNQVYNWVYVSGNHYHKPIEYDFTEYHYHIPHIQKGVVRKPDGVKVTDMERTVLDGISDFTKIGGLEELLKCIDLLPPLNEEKILEYLKLYHNPFLYQKTGYILEYFKEQLELSSNFFLTCQKNIDSTKRYLEKSRWQYPFVLHKKWLLYAPQNLERMILKGVDIDYDF